MTQKEAASGIATQRWEETRRAGWTSPLARMATGVLSFLTLTGLTIFGLPFSVFNQHAVLVHTAVGLAFTLPLAWYLVAHVVAYRGYPLTHTKFTGWASGVMAIVCSASGVVLAFEAWFGRRIDYAWRTVHIATTFGLIAFLVPHLVAVWMRERRRAADPRAEPLLAAARGHFRRAFAALAIPTLATAVLCAFFRPVRFNDEFPADYERDPYKNGSPFSPSLARTASGGAFDERALSGSQGCGTTNCHEQIVAEWEPSAHRYAAMDAGFQKIQAVMAAQNGPVSTRYCGGCHDPISLFSGTKNVGVEDLSALVGIREGVSCLSCHSIEQTDVKGNANYVMREPPRYVFELGEGAVAKRLSDFLIRAYPAQHVGVLSHRMFKTPEFCAACHKQFIDKEVNKVGWVQLQNQYDNWKNSRWNHPGEPRATLECRECHMPLVANSTDPAAGDAADFNRGAGDGKHRSHRFLGANQFIPRMHDLPHGDEHVALTEKWLKGEIEVPEIAERWRKGPAVPLEIEAPTEAIAGRTAPVRVHVLNNKVGHDFPTGPLDIIQAWIEVEAKDDAGRVVFRSGAVDERKFVETGTFMFKAEPVDRYGNLIDRHNLWEMVGVRFKRSLFPGSEEVASYDMPCSGATTTAAGTPADRSVPVAVPGDAEGALHVTARLQYRKFDQYLLNFAFGEGGGLTAPITTMSVAQCTIPVRPATGSE